MDAPGAAGVSGAEARLRNAGFRVTQPRLAVYRTLQELGGHRSADELLAGLRRRGRPLPRQSVYNALADLHAAGLLMLCDAGPGRTLYETNTVWHHHFVCRRCGRISDAPCLRGRKPCLLPPPRLGRADEAQVIFRGVCRACLRER